MTAQALCCVDCHGLWVMGACCLGRVKCPYCGQNMRLSVREDHEVSSLYGKVVELFSDAEGKEAKAVSAGNEGSVGEQGGEQGDGLSEGVGVTASGGGS